jgi:hypothetical protein
MEQLRTHFRVEALNAFNTSRFGSPNISVTRKKLDISMAFCIFGLHKWSLTVRSLFSRFSEFPVQCNVTG